MKLVIYGNLGFDKISSINGQAEVNGGAAYYCAAGASKFFGSIGVVGAVGEDYNFDALTKFGIPTDGIRVVKGKKSSVFDVKYEKDARTRTIGVELGAGESLWPALIPRSYMNDAMYFHITPLKPEKQMEAIKFVRLNYPSVKVSVDFIKDCIIEDAQAINEIANSSDIVFFDKEEAQALTAAGIEIKTDSVIKMGSSGAKYTINKTGEVIYAPAPHIPDVIDKSGAGDILEGALLAQFCMGVSDLHFALDNAVKCASEKVKHYGVDYIRSKNRV